MTHLPITNISLCPRCFGDKKIKGESCPKCKGEGVVEKRESEENQKYEG